MFSAPAEDIIEFVPVRFSMGIGKQSTVYQGEPSDVVDKAWEDLYNSKLCSLTRLQWWCLLIDLTDFGISKISKSQAQRLPNKTIPITGDEDNYVVALSVFHQLHCLVPRSPFLYLGVSLNMFALRTLFGESWEPITTEILIPVQSEVSFLMICLSTLTIVSITYAKHWCVPLISG